MGKRPKAHRKDYFADAISKLIEEDLQSGDFGCTLDALSHSEKCAGLFLNIYDENAIRTHFSKIGLMTYLEKKGFRDALIEITRDDLGVSRLKMFHGMAVPGRLLIDMKVSETMFTPFKKFCIQDHRMPCTFRMIVIEWIESAHPGKKFTRERPQLPGQKRPGLGVLKFIRDFLEIVGRDVAHDGFMNVPDHVHTAVMYADTFRFVNPDKEGFIRALLRDLKDVALNDIAWGFITGTVTDAAGAPHVYRPSEQMHPLSERLIKHFNEPHYLEAREKSFRDTRFVFDRKAMIKKREKMLEGKNVADM